jgi:DNA-binding transcriptional MerR regulator
MPEWQVKRYRIADVARITGIKPGRLYVWEERGVLRPEIRRWGVRQMRYYSQEDVERAVFVKFLVEDQGYALPEAIKKIDKQEMIFCLKQ